MSPLGGAVYSSRWLDDTIWNNDNGFLLVFVSNFTSIMHRFRDNDVFLQTENDVMVISPLGGAARSFRWRILKGWPQVYIHALLTYFAYLQPLKSYSTFSFWLGFPYCWRNLWGFRGKWPPKSQNSEKILALRALPYVKPRLLSYRAWKSVDGYGLYARQGKKKQ